MHNLTLFRSLLLALATTALMACSPDSADPEPVAEAAVDPVAETERLNAWFEVQFEEQLQFSPLQMTFMGRKERYGEIDDLSIPAQDALLEWYAQSVETMKTEFDYEHLTDDGKLSWDIWEYEYDRAVAGVRYRYNGFTFDQMNGLQSFLPTFLISFHRVDEAEDLEAYVSRINAAATALDQLLVIAERAADQGIVTPRFALEGVIEQATKVVTGTPFQPSETDSDLWADFEQEVETLLDAEKLDDERAEDLRNDARIALVENFQPAYDRVIAWARKEMEKSPEIQSGVADQPNGSDYYSHRLWTQTTTRLTADEVHEIGLAEVARIRGEMETVKAEIGFDGTLGEFFDHLRENKDDRRLYYPNDDEGRQGYIDDATAAIENIKGLLPDYFGLLPKADLVVKRVEPFESSPAPPSTTTRARRTAHDPACTTRTCPT